MSTSPSTNIITPTYISTQKTPKAITITASTKASILSNETPSPSIPSRKSNDLDTKLPKSKTPVGQLVPCGNGQMHLCKNGLACLPSSMFCDGFVDCSDGSDETEGKRFKAIEFARHFIFLPV